jgi:hypothetical protein
MHPTSSSSSARDAAIIKDQMMVVEPFFRAMRL